MHVMIICITNIFIKPVPIRMNAIDSMVYIGYLIPYNDSAVR